MSLKPTVSHGAIHNAPKHLKDALQAHAKAHETWEDITPLARNEWICWMESAKKPETRAKRMHIGIKQLTEGKRRPCCWPGCPHRD